MRISMFLCAVLLASAVCSSLLATGVSIPTKLRGTAAGQRVVDIYKGLVDRMFASLWRGLVMLMTSPTTLARSKQ